MLEGIFKFGYEDLTDAFKIREEVFQIEQNISPALEFDDWDREAIHGIVYDHGEPVATGRVFFDGAKYKIGRIAVKKSKRGLGYGDFIVSLLIDKAFTMGAGSIYLGAQQSVQGFYEKFGFKPYDSPYMEAGIPHIGMKLIHRGYSTCKE